VSARFPNNDGNKRKEKPLTITEGEKNVKRDVLLGMKRVETSEVAGVPD
jgi:hypothetical protein